MAARQNRRRNRSTTDTKKPVSETSLRIVGGEFRGRKLKYAGDTRVRPMKNRVREAVFNLLGPAVKGTYALDLFGGTGALGLEAISRGAVGATIVERHIPTSKVVKENIATLGVQDRAELIVADTFRWYRHCNASLEQPWTVFVAPPYRFFVERNPEMLQLIRHFLKTAPMGSLVVVEATQEFDFTQLPQAATWDVRTYPPAVVGVMEITALLRTELPDGSAGSGN